MKADLEDILVKHKLWVEQREGGQRANLYGADLHGVDLRGTDLCEADLRWANLRGANLCGADLYGADLHRADLHGAILPCFQICPEEGDFIAWKKVLGGVIKLLIPAGAKRTSTLVGRKCRAEFVDVLESVADCRGIYDSSIEYAKGARVYPDQYDDDIKIECTHGIHFFMTRQEAEEYLN